jgi:hypothetical protein
MEHIIRDAKTGEVKSIPFTAEEIAAASVSVKAAEDRAALIAERISAKTAPKVSAFKSLARLQVRAMAADPAKREDLVEVLALAVWADLQD